MKTFLDAFFAAALATTTPATAQTPALATPAPSFVPAEFNPPTHVEAAGFTLVPLGPDVVKVDFDAYMLGLSTAHLGSGHLNRDYPEVLGFAVGESHISWLRRCRWR